MFHSKAHTLRYVPSVVPLHSRHKILTAFNNSNNKVNV